MNNYFLFVLLPNIGELLKIISFIGFVLSIFFAIFAEEEKKFINHFITIVVFTLIVTFISCFIPTKKDVLKLKAISAVSEIKGIDKIPQKLIDLLNDSLEGNKEND